MENLGFIEKKDSVLLYGIAVLLMVAHHLFGFPDRFSGEIIPNWDTLPGIVLLYVGYFGKICVAMYAFISGYGMQMKCSASGRSVNKKSVFRDTINQILKFYSRYWLVVIIFLCIGILIHKKTFEWVEFVKNLIGISSSYNAEWWYAIVYIKMLITFPFVHLLFKVLGKNKKVANIMILCVLVFLILLNSFVMQGDMTYYLCFWVGMACAYSRIFDFLPKYTGHLSILPAAVCIFLSIVLKFTISADHTLDMLVVLLLIYGCITLFHLQCIPTIIRKGLEQIGKYSIYIWLIHTFIIYYYFQKFILLFKYSPLMFIIAVVFSYFCAVLCDKLYHMIGHVVKRKVRK